jgi:hypothetical protein
MKCDVCFTPESGHGLEAVGCPLSANRDHRNQSKGFDRTHIYGIHVPVEEPSTASIAAIGEF